MAKKRASLGKWKVERVGEAAVKVILPKGMKVTGPKPTLEDILHAVATKMTADDGGEVSAMCCHGDVAIA